MERTQLDFKAFLITFIIFFTNISFAHSLPQLETDLPPNFIKWLDTHSDFTPFSAWNTNGNHYIPIIRKNILDFLYSKCTLNAHYIYLPKDKKVYTYAVNPQYDNAVDKSYKVPTDLNELSLEQNIQETHRYGIKLEEAIDFLKNTHTFLKNKDLYSTSYKYLINSDLKGIDNNHLKILKIIQLLRKNENSSGEDFDLNFLFLSPSIAFHLFLFLLTNKDEELLSLESIAGIRFVRSKIQETTPLLEPSQRISLFPHITRRDMELYETILPFSALFMFKNKKMFKVNESKFCSLHKSTKTTQNFSLSDKETNIEKKLANSVQALFTGYPSQIDSQAKTIVFFADYEEAENIVLKELPMMSLQSLKNIRFIFDVDESDFTKLNEHENSEYRRHKIQPESFYPILSDFFNKARKLQNQRNYNGSIVIENINP